MHFPAVRLQLSCLTFLRLGFRIHQIGTLTVCISWCCCEDPTGLKSFEECRTFGDSALASPPRPVGLLGLVGPSSSSSEITLKPISEKVAFLDGRSLADNAEPVLLSILAIVAVSQGQGRTLHHS